ncbi:MAG: hypothetical protein WCK51_05775 [Armatimonadota bacterium]
MKSDSQNLERVAVLIRVAEVLQDPESCLELHDFFLRQSDPIRAFAAFEQAVLIDMRRSTDKNLTAFRQKLEQDKADRHFHREQEAYIQSLLDRYIGSLE